MKPNVKNNDEEPLFSFFKAPITNTTPHSKATLRQIYNAIKGNCYKERTEKLREMLASAPSPLERAGGEAAKKFKSTSFDYCTFSGTFTARNNKALIKHSGLLCLDFDHINNVDALRNQLLQDEYFDTQLLFRSPSGNGIKWIIQINLEDCSHGDYFTAVANYIQQTYGIAVDKSGRDVSRACFLPHDPNVIYPPHNS